jgi:uncharacterized membrane protein YdfJ with MMPL/SSD domain
LHLVFEADLPGCLHSEHSMTGPRVMGLPRWYVPDRPYRPRSAKNSSALVMAISFSALIASPVSIMRMFGMGLTPAVAMDATPVRMLLVPAVPPDPLRCRQSRQPVPVV